MGGTSPEQAPSWTITVRRWPFWGLELAQDGCWRTPTSGSICSWCIANAPSHHYLELHAVGGGGGDVCAGRGGELLLCSTTDQGLF